MCLWASVYQCACACEHVTKCAVCVCVQAVHGYECAHTHTYKWVSNPACVSASVLCRYVCVYLCVPHTENTCIAVARACEYTKSLVFSGYFSSTAVAYKGFFRPTCGHTGSVGGQLPTSSTNKPALTKLGGTEVFTQEKGHHLSVRAAWLWVPRGQDSDWVTETIGKHVYFGWKT